MCIYLYKLYIFYSYTNTGASRPSEVPRNTEPSRTAGVDHSFERGSTIRNGRNNTDRNVATIGDKCTTLLDTVV